MDYGLLFECPAYNLGISSAALQGFVTMLAAIHCNIATTNWPTSVSITEAEATQYDFIVVGGGTAGSVVAGRLAENSNIKVLLVEAGTDPPLESEIPGMTLNLYGEIAINWIYETEDVLNACKGYDLPSCTAIYGKMLGGSHALNFMQYFRGTSRDYDEWKLAGNSWWGWHEVQYYFQKTEKFRGKKNPYGMHGVRGPLDVEPFRIPQNDQILLRKAAKQLGHTMVSDFTDGPNIGFGKVYGTLRDGQRMTTAKAFLLKEKSNLHILRDALVSKISFDADLRASSINIDSPETESIVTIEARKEIIITAGPIETPKLLMLSGIGPKAHLEALDITVLKDLPVGYNLQDHIGVGLYLRVRNEVTKSKNLLKQQLDAFYSQLVHAKGPYGAVFLDFSGFVATDGNPDFSDIQFIYKPVENITDHSYEFINEIGSNMRGQLNENKDQVLLVYAVLQKPKSRGYVRLTEDSYPVPPKIENNYLEHKDDVKRLAKGLDALVDFERTDIFKKFSAEFVRIDIKECDKHKYRSEKYWECYSKYMSTSFYNHAGTTKMGPKTDKTAVVNPELEVYGVKGLRVIGSAIMPTIVSVDTTIPGIMIAEKGVDFIKKRWEI